MVVPLKRIDKIRWEIPKFDRRMRVPGRVYADEVLLEKMKSDRTLEQAANVAMLPGIYKYSIVMPDGHQGYGFPIGGVAAFDVREGVISPGGIGYDINCLSPGTKVLTEHGYWVKIEAMPSTFKLQGLKVYNIDEGHNDSSPVVFVAERKVEENEVAVRIVTETGRTIEGSEDHPVLTPSGYIYMGNIREGDYIIVYPFEGVEFEKKEGVILSEDDFKDVDPQILKFLKERGLIPLRWNDPKVGILARILGFAFGDGHLGYMGDRIYISFYGTEEAMNELKKDLEKLGINATLYVREREYEIGKYRGISKSAELRVTSRAFVVLLMKLGMPIGKKVEVEYSLPGWIKEAPLWIKRNFLAGLFGADGSVVEFKRYTPISINLTQSKVPDLRDNLEAFLSEVADLLREFGVNSMIYEVSSDKTVTLRLAIVEEDSIKNFLGRINYEYAPEKKVRGLLGYAYLVRKQLVKEERKEAARIARKVYEKTGSLKAAYEAVADKVNKRFVERVIYSGTEEGRVPQNFPTFEEFVREFGYEGGFVAERVVKVEKIRPTYDKFYDIGVYHEAHNFIANGAVVHNCGVRLIRTNLTEKEVRPKIKQLVDTLFKNVPSGVGSQGRIRLHWTEIDDVLVDGAKWAVDHGYGWGRDLERLEEGGRMEGADPNAVSQRAKQRGAPQLGSLGSGNHFLEVQVVDKIFDPEIAKVYGLFEGQVVVMVHTGSRGLGHQVASDYLRIMERAIRKYRIPWPDRELVSVPFQSEEGQRYFSAMKAAANFAWANRQMITHWVRESFQEVFRQDPEGDLGMDIVYDVAHNIGKVEEHEVDGKKVKVIVHRKGATRAFPPGHEAVPRIYRDVGQPVLIPGSMGTASYVLAGTEGAMKETFGSTCHGAGRVLSRKAATRQYRGDRIRNELLQRGIYVRAASMRVVAEEAPGAYKNVDNVVKVVSEAGIAKLVARLRPIGVAKG
ncbi:RNA-splicing ligase RtcB [Thermococcus chitonophagus]|uniref:tRNA-splicing ligase RtcB n=1 Tax=Thermococcus chitonophagus TaxID=54262 RepID=A0A160VUT2_9EURY|nr:intein-containing RctB family protein [Thermococcus chitonophagus]ASJ16389.1 RNA-splicing ligase RtcB [Thermococcus chitonophagus]CUX78619.1 RNA-2',3'-PO4:RNA-5'-OH ligase @ intein-containing [Thermococcus chitonophagus]